MQPTQLATTSSIPKTNKLILSDSSELLPSNCVVVDIQMIGLHNYFIKEFAAYGEDINMHFFMKYTHARSSFEKFHNKLMKDLHGIPANYPGEPKYKLCNSLIEIARTKDTIIVYGHNKKQCLENFIETSHLPKLNIINLQHEFRNESAFNDLYDSRQIEFYNRCPLPAHKSNIRSRCSAKRTIDLYHSILKKYNQTSL